MNLRHIALVCAGSAVILAGCERPPVDTVQRGYRGTGMEEIYNPRVQAAVAAANQVPAPQPPASPDGPKAGQIYQNVKVLGDLSVGQFTRLMAAMSSWVAPNEGCAYCHNVANLADDGKYTKVVARRMLQMTEHINANWSTHVAPAGVTCYTCHRGNHIPANVWFAPPVDPQQERMLGNNGGKDSPSLAAGLSALPRDPFTPFLLDTDNIRVQGTEALPADNRHSIKQAEWTYALMIHMSKSLGVNCTFCHNTRDFGNWKDSTPQRATAWYGIRMVRDLNVAYLGSLKGVFPQTRLGPDGDVAKLDCATCHQGAYRPLFGASMLKDYPELAGAPSAAAGGTTVSLAAPAAAPK